MAIQLKDHELRVLGVLIEKSLGLPQYYPMTINSITAACNQKNNRDPVMSLTEGDVSSALHSLTLWQLVSQAPPEPGARTNRFRHEVEKRFGWNAPMRAIMAELMIRGPQTLGELRTNAGRLTHLDATDHIREVLGELQRAEQPMVAELPRQVGQSANRFTQLLGGPVPQSPASPSASISPLASPPATPVAPPTDLAARVKALEERVSALESRLLES
ncbi:MAG TPA: DUF480 domain-containing protein [Phycisphaerae bacterium]|nr:DUF480 domain-containing protein [Phycisphaerae bacterium]